MTSIRQVGPQLLLQERGSHILQAVEKAFITAQPRHKMQPVHRGLGRIHDSWKQTTFPTNTRQGHPCPTFSPTAGKLQASPFFIVTILEDRPSPVRCGVKWGAVCEGQGQTVQSPRTKATAGNWSGREAPTSARGVWGSGA